MFLRYLPISKTLYYIHQYYVSLTSKFKTLLALDHKRMRLVQNDAVEGYNFIFNKDDWNQMYR